MYYNKRLLSPNLVICKPGIRKLKDLKDVLMDPYLVKNKSKNMYYMYRMVHLPEHKRLFKKYKMRWDITVIPPGRINKEFTKTAGHHHKGVEVYEVLYGEALYIFQNKKQFLIYHAKAGTRVIVPYEYWHVAINHKNKLLILANLMPEGVKYNYKDIKSKHGMAYFYVKGGKWISNRDFDKLPKINKLKAKKFKTPIYWEFVKNPKKFKLRRK